MCWRKKKKRAKQHNQEKPVDLPYSSKEIELMVSESKKLALLSHLKNFITNIRIESETGKKALENLAEKLQLRFSVEFALTRAMPLPVLKAAHPILSRRDTFRLLLFHF